MFGEAVNIFTGILEILARKESKSITQLAREVGYSVREIQSALEQMEHMGYIRHNFWGQTCNSCCGTDRGTPCAGCGFSATDKLTIWVLTERGHAIVDSQAAI